MNMKILVIGDVHGTPYWKEHLKKLNNYDKICFLGDYFDTWKNDWVNCNQIDNLEEILNYKKAYPNKIDVLIGNHDLAYITGEIVSGHQHNKAIDIKEFLNKNLDYFDIAVRYNDWVLSHAGFSCYWMKKFGFIDIKDVNEAFHFKNYEPFRFFAGDYSYSGDSYLQGPTWIRPSALKFCSYYDKQIVGHTATDYMQTNHLRYKGFNSQKQELWIIDANDHKAFKELVV